MMGQLKALLPPPETPSSTSITGGSSSRDEAYCWEASYKAAVGSQLSMSALESVKAHAKEALCCCLPPTPPLFSPRYAQQRQRHWRQPL